MDGHAAVVPPAFDEAVRDFISEQLRREPFSSVGRVEEQLSPVLKKLSSIEETLVRGSFVAPIPCCVYISPTKGISLGKVEKLETMFKDKMSGSSSVSLDA